MRPLCFSQIARIFKLPALLIDGEALGYGADSRLIKPGDLFIALQGDLVDGHAYLDDVFQKGAVAAIVSKEYRNTNNYPVFFVENPLYALQELAKAVVLEYAEHTGRVIGVTGSLGKTSTKEFIKTLLQSTYKVFASPGNSNSQVGLPLAILNHTTGVEELLVLEMGMTHKGQINRLIQIAPPEVSVITTTALVHACNFTGLEEIALAKGEIFSHPHTKAAIFPYELHQSLAPFCNHCAKISFSITYPLADYGIDPLRPHVIEARLENKRISIGPLPIPGKHNLHNVLAAIAVARYYDVPWEQIQEMIPLLALSDRRLEFVERNGITFLNDSYNAAEKSVKAALESLPPPKEGGRKIAVLGSMMELGTFSTSCHHEVGKFALEHVEQMYCLGEECTPIHELWKKEGREVALFTDRKELVACLRSKLAPNDVVLLKGSRSKELWKVLEELFI